MIPYAVWQTLAGGLGGLVRALVGITKGKEFNPDTFKFQWKYFGFSIVVSIIVGQMAGLIMNSDWRMSLLAGYAGADLLESLYKLRFAQMMKS